MARRVHENSLANLRPPWRPGYSANPAGRTRGGAHVSEHINSLLAETHDGRPMYTREQIERIAERDKSPAKVMAAREILCAMQPRQRYVKDRRGKVYPAGTDPEPGRALDRVINRLEGKPKATLAIERAPERSVEEIEAELRALLAGNPDLVEYLQQLQPVEGKVVAAELPTPGD